MALDEVALSMIRRRGGNQNTLVLQSDASFDFAAGQLTGGNGMYIPISLASTGLTNLSAAAEASGVLIGGATSASMADLTDFTEVKFMMWLVATGTGTLRAAYDNGDGNGWRALGDTLDLAQSAVGLYVTDWADIAAAARAPCIFAARAYAGNGTHDPGVRALGIMVR